MMKKNDYIDSRLRENDGLKKGFTLLELLVVIGIIGVLVSLAAVAYSSAQRKSRDSRRQSDLKSMQSAEEIYYSENSYLYPVTCSDADVNIKGIWPTDPVGADELVYTAFCDVDSYYICAKLEVDSKGNSTALPTTADGTNHSWGTGNYYCVSNLQ
jgi:prepilin-type N-terminal cleavage/methylation domain-containing protein